MLHRLTSIPLNTHDYQDELNTIKYIAVKNGYNPELINYTNESSTQKVKHI